MLVQPPIHANWPGILAARQPGSSQEGSLAGWLLGWPAGWAGWLAAMGGNIMNFKEFNEIPPNSMFREPFALPETVI